MRKVSKSILKVHQPHFDGAGAQMLRIFLTFAIAQNWKMGFVYDPLQKIDTQVFENEDELEKWNDFLDDLLSEMTMCNDKDLPTTFHTNHRSQFVLTRIRILDFLRKPKVHVIDSPQVIVNKFPEFLSSLKFDYRLSKYRTSDHRQPLRIVLHIRQGELALSQFKDRYLGLEYFEQVLRLIIPTLSQSQIPHELIVCTESNQEKLLPASDIKIIESIRLDPLNPNLIKVDDKHFKVVHEKPTTSDTPLLTQCKWSEGQGAYSDFLTFLNADILVLSKSSFSYLAALLNPNALVIYPDFWHPPLSTWVSTKDEATLLSRLRTKIRHRSSLKN